MKKITMLDIAKKAGVSKATVSLVINKKDKNISKETKNKILTIAKELNYIPNSIARSLTTNKSQTIGIILPDITNPFFSEIARAIEDKANTLGYNVILCNTDNQPEKEEKYTKLLISKLIDGIIFITGGKGIDNLKMLSNNNIPFVLVDRYIKNFNNFYGVFCLNKKGIKKGIDYLYSKNKRKIAFVTGTENLEISKERLSAYIKAMQSYNLLDYNLIFEGDFTIDGGIEATKKILNYIKNIDAIFYSNDIMAYGGMKTLIKNGYNIPKDISIIGFDNILISKFFEPELTTISQPIYKMGKESCQLLINLINKIEIPKKQIYFEPKLIIRNTVK